MIFWDISLFGFTLCLFVFVPFCLFVLLSVCLFVFLSFCLFVFLSFCLFVFLSFCLFVFLSCSTKLEKNINRGPWSCPCHRRRYRLRRDQWSSPCCRSPVLEYPQREGIPLLQKSPLQWRSRSCQGASWG